ncbi:MAG: 2-hydroxyacyl-CoA dehydratase family protein [Mesorhizobium sp.]|nr:2-hydroxyacyl-CoA dehydratase family protein [Mesorhizobium sp.]MCO5161345.1 2-hydroxyacyl-CoA dehydratase family protein [Mesorhizobium sp.]
MERTQIIDSFAAAARDPLSYAKQWKGRTGRPVIGSFPMNFPGELAHAAGALPMILQESDDPITVGHGLLFPFYCGYTRSMVDQAVRGDFDVLDAIMFGDHCVQLLGAADAIRMQLTNTRVIFFQLISSMCDPWTQGRSEESFAKLRAELEDFVGAKVQDESMHASIRLFNKNRGLIRRLYDMRKKGIAPLGSVEMQHVVKSSMVMDKAEHTELLEKLVRIYESAAPLPARNVRLHLSGHFCQAPKPELLEMIEECGVTVVGDDLYHGFRYISTDVPEQGDPIAGLARWYMDRNTGVPCPTRVQNNVDWDAYLLNAMRDEKADGMIVLMAKFCEPHMYYYPEVKEAFEKADMPHLLIETEHEGMALESLKTRVETFVEIVKHRQAA